MSGRQRVHSLSLYLRKHAHHQLGLPLWGQVPGLGFRPGVSEDSQAPSSLFVLLSPVSHSAWVPGSGGAGCLVPTRSGQRTHREPALVLPAQTAPPVELPLARASQQWKISLSPVGKLRPRELTQSDWPGVRSHVCLALFQPRDRGQVPVFGPLFLHPQGGSDNSARVTVVLGGLNEAALDLFSCPVNWKAG